MEDQPSDRPIDSPVLDVDVLIVGAGPTGASLACFLASHGELDCYDALGRSVTEIALIEEIQASEV